MTITKDEIIDTGIAGAIIAGIVVLSSLLLSSLMSNTPLVECYQQCCGFCPNWYVLLQGAVPYLIGAIAVLWALFVIFIFPKPTGVDIG